MLFPLLVLVLLTCAPGWAERILYFAPHPDDEVISLGGWLFDRQSAGDTVAVVVVTDGGRFPRAAIGRKFKPSLFLRRHDFRTLARTRRRESNRALDFLRVPAQHRYFLGYPSGALGKMFRTTRPDAMFRCPALGQRYGVSDLAGCRRSPHPFSQRSLVTDIDRLITAYAPDIVVLPHPRDSNADHQAVHAFVRRSLAKKRVPALIRWYLVHQGSRKHFPQPYGYKPAHGINFPARFPPPQRVRPSQKGLEAKEKAIRAHRSQIRLRDGFLLSFIRKEEMYWDDRPDTLVHPHPGE